MSVASTPEGQDVLPWIRTYDVRWELAPLDELMPGRGLQQTGYVLRLFGRLPPDPRDRDQRLVEALYQRLRALATEALRVIPLDFRVNVQPFPRVVVARNSPFAVDVELTALASPARADDGPTPEERRRSIGVIEAKLRSLGAKRNPEPPCERLLRGARFGVLSKRYSLIECGHGEKLFREALGALDPKAGIPPDTRRSSRP